MTAEEHTRERRYQLAMHFARKMLREGMINADDYAVIEAKMTLKFNPVLGQLLARNDLLFTEKRANM